MALSVLFFDRIAGISHGADAALHTSATNPRQILRFPAAESCRPYCRIEVGRSSRMRRLVLHSADRRTNFKNTTLVDFAALRRFPLIIAEPKNKRFFAGLEVI
jgi:hypothetical protein